MYATHFFLKKGHNSRNKIKFTTSFEYAHLPRMAILATTFYRILVRGYRIVALSGLAEVQPF